MAETSHIRNFCIIAHIDHGKSTLSDRLLETTGTVEKRKLQEQMLDSLDIERERGITIKAAAVTLQYTAKNGEKYTLNLIDTPGHVDFTYEVSRSLAACEGAILVVDASQGVEAQTLANYYLAYESNLTILPVINKIDLPSADVPAAEEQIEHELGLDRADAMKVSAKMGLGIDELLEKIVAYFPPPPDDAGEHLKALIFDSFFDIYRGAVVCVRVFQGTLKVGERIRLFHDGKEYLVEEVGLLGLARQKRDALCTGEVGYAIFGIKSVSEVRVGDTVTGTEKPCPEPLPGYKEVKPMVFAGIFPVNTEDYADLKDAMEKLKLNDSALTYEPDNSLALGFGFRCGFLGLLHMDIVQERLSREFDMPAILTAPSVAYWVTLRGKGGTEDRVRLDNPAKWPEPTTILLIEEPFIRAKVITPNEYQGAILQLVMEKRGIQKGVVWLDKKRVEVEYEIPLNEVVFDFYDRLKSLSKGYASLDYEIIDFRPSDIIKIEILVNKEPVDALSFLVNRDKARDRAKTILEKLKDEIPRHMFAIPLQAANGAAILAREDINAMRKDVTAKCYGGDISRKRKLLEKQKEGKKRMKSIGSVDIPQKAFINILKT
jgi:GTP-binding protein LepA